MRGVMSGGGLLSGTTTGRTTHVNTAVDLLVADERLGGNVGGGPAAVEREAAAGVVIFHPTYIQGDGRGLNTDT